MKNLLKSLGLFSLFFNTHPQMNGVTECDIPYEDCDNEFVCPKITEVTTCGNDGLDEYASDFESGVIDAGIYRNGTPTEDAASNSTIDCSTYNPLTDQDTIVDSDFYINI